MWRRRIISSLAVAAAMGCEPETDIRGELVLERMAPVDFPGVATAVGVLDDWVLITSIEYQAPQPEPWGEVVYETFVTWVDPEDHVGEPISLGRSNQPLVDRPRWVAWEGALWGSVMATQAEVPPTQRHFVRIVGIRPDGISCILEPELDFAEDDFLATASFATALGGSHPAVLTPTGPLFTISGAPRGCGPGTLFQRPLGLAVGPGCDSRVQWLLAPDCARDPLLESAANWPVVRETSVGVLSTTFLQGPVVWHLTGDDASPPITVGSQRPNLGGRVPTAFTFDNWVIFLEGSQIDARCSFLRRMRWDGSDASNAPWQLPCAPTRTNGLGVESHARDGRTADLLPLEGVALVAVLDAPSDHGDPPAEALLVALTARGQRASSETRFAASAVVAGTSRDTAVALAREDTWTLRRYRWRRDR